MNIFLARHWYSKYQYLTQCSPKHPFVRKCPKLESGEVNYSDPKELVEFLKTSEEAAYMWTDSEDLAIVADMYQMKIKVVTTKGSTDKNPTVNWINPDAALKKFSELKDTKIDDLVLLHENDSHFNLVVSKESDLVKYGSLSYRFNVGPIMYDEDVMDDQAMTNDDDEEFQPEDEELTDVKKQLKECRKEKQNIEIEYYKCEKELNLKTEECEKLKIVIKDLKEIEQLKNDLEETDKAEAETENEPKDDNSNPWITKKPVKRPKGANVKGKVVEEYNCTECDFQGTTDIQLRKHVNLKHTSRGHDNTIIECRICGEGFDVKWKLMKHRKIKHITSVAPCKNYIEEKCNFTALMCWWNHEEKQIGQKEDIDCFVCNETFQSKPELMTHRKKNHSEIIRQCIQFSQNNCRYEEESCWYKHAIEQRDNEMKNEGNNIDEDSDSDFQEASMKKKPPIPQQKLKKNL